MVSWIEEGVRLTYVESECFHIFVSLFRSMINGKMGLVELEVMVRGEIDSSNTLGVGQR